ncbi:hypothetical protein Ahy_A03g015018 [Arachis hypogaea]|uniref:Uncharacterized protein n=1 Tax=Arachis hypogaea TaxID=3818 RepID=A0A445DZ68_ARAHY|nr:hypothetical protein Ahy_A03g015018 [Arachis hypogaea]
MGFHGATIVLRHNQRASLHPVQESAPWIEQKEKEWDDAGNKKGRFLIALRIMRVVAIGSVEHTEEDTIQRVNKANSTVTGAVVLFLKTHDLRCSTRLLNEKFQNMSKEKKAIVQELGFDGLMHILAMNELAYFFNVITNKLNTQYGVLIINPENIGAVLGFNASKFTEEDKEVYRSFQGKTLKQLTDLMMEIGVDSNEDQLTFKKVFILYIQIVFLLPTTINKISPVHMPPIFRVDTIREWNWGGHILDFLIKDITEHVLKKNKSVDDCLYALMIVYFHESKHKNKGADAIPRPS